MAPIVRFAVVALLLAGLAACASGPARKADYRAAPPPPPLEVPPDLVKPAEDLSLNVPSASGGSASFSGLQQPNTGTGAVAPVPDNIRVGRAGNQRWLVVRAEPEALWPRVREFFPQHGLVIAKENRLTGMIETEWAENRANVPDDMPRRLLGKVFDNLYASGTRDKFRLRLERGAAAGTTEIYLSHRGLMEVVEETRGGTVQPRGRPRPSDPELEAEMLALLMTDLGADAKRARAQVSEAAPKEGAKLEDAERPLLKVYDRRDSAWRRTGLALDRAGWTLLERDQKAYRYTVAAPAGAATPDLPENDPQARAAADRAQGNSRDRTSQKTPDRPDRYEIMLTEDGSITTVQVRPLESADVQGGKRILSMLFEQLK